MTQLDEDLPYAWDDELAKMLDDGWVVVGYSTAMFAAGGFAHSVLLQRAAHEVMAVTITITKGELGRRFDQLSPAPAKR